MKYIDTEGKGHTLCIFTDAESRLLRTALADYGARVGNTLGDALSRAWAAGIQRGTERMAEESKAEWKARKK